jgi:hypothetical protein
MRCFGRPVDAKHCVETKWCVETKRCVETKWCVQTNCARVSISPRFLDGLYQDEPLDVNDHLVF